MWINVDESIFKEYIQWNNLSLEQGATLEDYRMALEKTKPKKPKDKEFSDTMFAKYWTGRCPCCDELIDDWCNFCEKCGQKIDWGKEQDEKET